MLKLPVTSLRGWKALKQVQKDTFKSISVTGEQKEIQMTGIMHAKAKFKTAELIKLGRHQESILSVTCILYKTKMLLKYVFFANKIAYSQI
jgi:hypothetical protein